VIRGDFRGRFCPVGTFPTAGPNEAALDMLDDIGSAANIGKFLARLKHKSESVRLMRFGHRVYKNFDPRAMIIRAMCYRVLGKLGIGKHPVFELALTLEEIALKVDYFVSRKLYPNVDLYSRIIYSA
jgi:citrate synthase